MKRGYWLLIIVVVLIVIGLGIQILDVPTLPGVASEGYVVWGDYRNGNWDIYMCDLSLNGKEGGCFGNDKKTQITTDPKNQQYPSISGDKIVWRDLRNDYGDIYMYDLSTEKETQITTDSKHQRQPSIWTA